MGSAKLAASYENGRLETSGDGDTQREMQVKVYEALDVLMDEYLAYKKVIAQLAGSRTLQTGDKSATSELLVEMIPPAREPLMECLGDYTAQMSSHARQIWAGGFDLNKGLRFTREVTVIQEAMQFWDNDVLVMHRIADNTGVPITLDYTVGPTNPNPIRIMGVGFLPGVQEDRRMPADDITVAA